MTKGRITLAAVGMMALAVPALALAGVRPPASTDYSAGGIDSLRTGGDKVGSDGLAEKVKYVYFSAYDCYNTPLVIDRKAEPKANMTISDTGEFSYTGKPHAILSEKTPGKVTLTGEFVSADQVDIVVDYKKRECEQHKEYSLPRFEE